MIYVYSCFFQECTDQEEFASVLLHLLGQNSCKDLSTICDYSVSFIDQYKGYEFVKDICSETCGLCSNNDSFCFYVYLLEKCLRQNYNGYFLVLRMGKISTRPNYFHTFFFRLLQLFFRLSAQILFVYSSNNLSR